jgi:integrase
MSVYPRGRKKMTEALERATSDSEAKLIQERLENLPYSVEVTLGGVRYILPCGTTLRRDAEGMESMLKDLHKAGKEDVLRYLRTRKLTLQEVYPAYRGGSLEPLLARVRASEQPAAQVTGLTLGVLVEKWTAWLKSTPVSDRSKRELSASTVARYCASMRVLLEFVARRQLDATGEKPDDISQETLAEAWKPLSPTIFDKKLLEDYRQSRKKAGMRAATINRDLLTLSGFYTWLESQDDLPPMKRPRFVREAENNVRERYLKPGEWEQVQQAFTALNGGTTQFLGRRSGGTRAQGVVPTAALWVLFETLVLTGLRLGEALALEWGDLDATQKIINVSRSLERGDGVANGHGANAVVKHPRGGRLKTLGSKRSVPLAAELHKRLNDHCTTFAAFGSARNDPIFPPEVFNMRRMQDLWNRAVAAAGIEPVKVHDLRHTFAIHALDSGTEINDLQEILGHSSIYMVMRYLKRHDLRKATRSGEGVAAILLHSTVP